MIFKNNVNSYIAISPKCMQRYKYINMVQVKKKHKLIMNKNTDVKKV
jgi:hypothetical protein